jgi:STE24 endopeptidase
MLLWLQWQAVLTKDPPQELSEHYSADHVKQTRAYSIDKKNFGLVKGVADFIESLTVLSFMLLPAAWRWSEQVVHAVKPSWSGNEYVVSVAFALLTIVFETVKSMPWSLYNAFVIEERHGFNKQTLAIFFTDVLKSVRHVAMLPSLQSECCRGSTSFDM